MIALLFLAACSERSPTAPGTDAGSDAAPDAAPPDAGADAGGDAGGPIFRWTVETVDEAGRADPSIAVGDDGALHVAYYAFPSDLRHATDASGAWVPDVVDDVPDTGGWSSVALAAGEMRVSYHDYDQGRLVLARGGPGAWATETIDTGPRGNGRYTAQAIDAHGASHVGFARGDLPGSDLAYATDASGAWVVETVEADGRSGEQTSLGIDSSGALHLVAIRRDLDGGRVRHATRSGTDWTLETVPLSDGALDAALAIDGEVLHLAWSGVNDGALHHAWRDGTDWSDEVVDDAGTARGVAIAIDPAGALQIAYQRAPKCPGGVCDRGDLVHASDAAGTWRIDVVDSKGTSGLTPAIAIAAGGLPVVAFVDQDTPSLRLARATRVE